MADEKRMNELRKKYKLPAEQAVADDLEVRKKFRRI